MSESQAVTPNIRVDVWKVNSDNPKSPQLNGYVTINGTRYPISLWANTSDNPKAPAFKGKLSKPSPKEVTFVPVTQVSVPDPLPF